MAQAEGARDCSQEPRSLGRPIAGWKAAEGRSAAGAVDVYERLEIRVWVYRVDSAGDRQVPGTVEIDQRRMGIKLGFRAFAFPRVVGGPLGGRGISRPTSISRSCKSVDCPAFHSEESVDCPAFLDIVFFGWREVSHACPQLSLRSVTHRASSDRSTVGTWFRV
jgi:hypothetical protein